ncbi:MAG: isomerase [Gammaproteobacteria bacterium]|nr:isomerase [Gammaproteobacteria bacterium]MBT5827198.1 isomerase [Gammaproteobacteria bacterium]MBT6419524.1 isomerase [Gammaproteobacteria bacterium]MBT6577070.1 isomerase [Gammaproteobacteria bacterium]MBT7435387.1 isomerase [Gammaproteobacteria bacterium]
MNQSINTKFYSVLIVLFIISGCTTVYQTAQTPDFEALYGPSEPKQRTLAADTKLAKDAVSYHKDIKPILDTRCVACHACYDAPCQLKLGSTQGIDRGSTKEVIYNVRLDAIQPTRLFVDATTTQGWREKDFYPVLNERIDSAQANINNSLLAKLLLLKRDNPLAESGKLAESFDLSLDRKLSCPTVAEFSGFKQDHPGWGMPYAMPGLSLKQEYKIMQWLQQGAEFDAGPVPVNDAVKEIAQWEQFFNGRSLKEQLVSRYIYEHLFLGHIHLQRHHKKKFYRLVRSTTPSGQEIKEIATVLPYDDPGVTDFYYRLRLVEGVIVDKTHFVYEFSENKMQRYKKLFFQTDYRVTKLPSYLPEVAANPFLAFAELPKNARYQFLLDNAQYFIAGFIKGPVCRGQVALNVIRDRFWVVFFRPDGRNNVNVINDKFNTFIQQQDKVLSLPGAAGKNLGLFGWRKYNKLAEEYLKNKNVFTNQIIDEYGGFTIDDIWNGNGNNQNAALTVFRHFNSATVVEGLVGDTPLTGWILDYPLFERIHYLLVAGFNVFDSVDHQLATRLYMDFLRMGGEDNFLRLMPNDQRERINRSWYKGISGDIANYMNTPYYSAGHETGVVYKTNNYKQEFFAQVRQHLGKAVNTNNTLRPCQHEACKKTARSELQQKSYLAMTELTTLKGSELALLPEMSIVKITGKQGKSELIYTLLLNKALENVAIMTSEDLRSEPEFDTLTIVPGFLGSYPNYFFHVQEQLLPEFITGIKKARSSEDREAFYAKYGVRRTNPEIWGYVDWFNAEHRKYRGLKAGLFDLNRYNNL